MITTTWRILWIPWNAGDDCRVEDPQPDAAVEASRRRTTRGVSLS
jgi:hypothetical protein